MKKFVLHSDYRPAGDQNQAINKLVAGLVANKKHQVLLGATGTGKTFTIANVIAQHQKQTLVLAHNKTLAMQLYVELKTYFPDNRVEYFVSNFDYYQPEAYIASRDLYIDKDVKHNMELDMMRLSAVNALISRKDTIVVASVAAIFAAQDPAEYEKVFFEMKTNQEISRKKMLGFLVSSGYTRNDYDLTPGSFSVKGDVIKIAPGDYDKSFIRLDFFGEELTDIAYVDALNNNVQKKLNHITIFPAQSYVTTHTRLHEAIKRIKQELSARLAVLNQADNKIAAYRLQQKTEHDLEMLSEFGTCPGVENYSMHLDLRTPEQPPYTLLNYFEKNFLTVIDESHITIPQVRGMFNTNVSRKKNLIEYGFRLPSAMFNRPLNFKEFSHALNQVIYTSATPAEYESNLVKKQFVHQIIRPTGLLDPQVEVKNPAGQMNFIIESVKAKSKNNEKVLVTTLTKKMAEDVASYLQSYNLKATYLHSELKTLERTIVINDLRRGVYDCLIGVNLLREGIDIPELALICILDADKPGFLRDHRSLIQIIGRASRNVHGKVVLFANEITTSMRLAMEETAYRRKKQKAFNTKHHIIPKSIVKEVAQANLDSSTLHKITKTKKNRNKKTRQKAEALLITELKQEMLAASAELNFEKAATLRDIIIELKGDFN